MRASLFDGDGGGGSIEIEDTTKGPRLSTAIGCQGGHGANLTLGAQIESASLLAVHGTWCRRVCESERTKTESVSDLR